jgi:predicted dehydrogenase
VGFVGIGVIAETHLKVLAEDERLALAFTVDPNRADPIAFRGTRPPHYTALCDALDAHDPQLLVIATPTETHADLAVQALTGSTARVLVEKPLVHDLDTLARLRKLDSTVDLRERLLTAHHFAFSPEVRWAAEQLTAHPEWGPVTSVTSAFYDPYVLRGQQAFDSYVSSWMDSGVNQLSVLARLVDLTRLLSGSQSDGGASAWHTVAYTSRGTTGRARLRSSWRTGASSKETALSFAESGVEVWIDHTAMTGFAAQNSELLSTHGSDGRTPRKIAHYRPLYDSLFSSAPDVVLGFDMAATITELQHAPVADSGRPYSGRAQR